MVIFIFLKFLLNILIANSGDTDQTLCLARCLKNCDRKTNSINFDQTAPVGAG